MRSLYKRQLTMMVWVMVLSFTLLSTAFMLLSYRYIISEKRDAMARNASYIATFTASYYQQYDSIQDKIYSNYVASIARISDSRSWRSMVPPVGLQGKGPHRPAQAGLSDHPPARYPAHLRGRGPGKKLFRLSR